MFSQRIKELRKNKGITQIEFAKLFNIATGTIAMYETGKRQPDYETLKRIAEFFNVSTDYLLGNEQKEIRPSEEERIIEMLDSNPELKKLIEEAISLPSDKQKSLLEYAIFQKSQLENDKNHLD